MFLHYNMHSPSTDRNLYALLVAINDYAPPITPLRGCVNDLYKVQRYLNSETLEFRVHIATLVNDAATKDNIVRHFEQHLGNADADDVVLFYFSGHGTQEDAAEVFHSIDHDRMLECIVCFDSYVIKDGHPKFRLLADKELRYLIAKVASRGAHVVCIFDCCHSGSNTRNGIVVEGGGDIRERRVVYTMRPSHAFPPRPWSDFIFSKTVNEEEASANSISEMLPEGKHIQMAACQSDESAYEAGGEGMFTKNLIEVLQRSEGSVSYYDLQSRIQNYIRGQFNQTPKAYVVGDDESSMFLGFLNKRTPPRPLYGNLVSNEKSGWVVDLGTIHSISKNADIKIEDQDNIFVTQGVVRDAFPAYAVIDPQKALNKNLEYKAYPSHLAASQIRVFIDISDQTISDAIRHDIRNLAGDSVMVVESLSSADYLVRYEKEMITISSVARPDVPIVQPISDSSPVSLQLVTRFLMHLSRYEYVRTLHNANSFLFARDPISITIYQRKGEREEEVALKQGVADFHLVDAQNTQRMSVRFKLKNTSDRKLYCALLYLSFNFGVYVKLFNEVTVALEPGQEVWARDGATIPLKLEDEVIHYNYPHSTSVLKLMVSTSDFKQQVLRFELPDLPGPLRDSSKGLDVQLSAFSAGQIEDWITKEITIRVSK